MHLCVFILYLLCTILSLQAQGIPSLSIPSGDALTLDGNTQVVLPEFLFGGPFSVEAWVLANFNSTTDTPGPLLYFGNENDADKVEIGIDAGGYLYLELGVSDKVAFQEQIPTDPVVLSHITPFLTTPLADVYGPGPVVRRVQFQIPASFSGQWILLDIKETSSGVITFFINRVQVFQTSTLDLPVLPMYLFRTYNLIGANPSQNFLGNLQVITLWGRPLANNDITSGNTVKLNDGGLIGRWDFSFVVNGVVLNQAADAKEAINKATQDVQRQLDVLQQQLATAQASYAANPSPATLLVLNEAQAAIDQAKKVPNTQGVVSSDKGFKSTAQVNLINSIRAQANSGSGDPAAIAAQVQLYAQATRDHTTNTANDLATIASAFTQDTDVWLNAALNGLNKLPHRATSANARSLLQTSQLAQSTSVRNSASIDERLDGIIVQEGSKKRGADTQATRQCNTPTFDLSCTWCNDPHFTLRTANYSGRTGFSIAFDYMSPTCHWILLSGDVMIQEQSYKCNGAAGCITSVGAFIANRYVVIFSNNGSISVNGKLITCLPYTIDCDRGLYIQRTSTYGNTLVTPDFQLGLSGGSSASLLFTSDEYWNADPHSICVNKVNQPGKALSPAYYDVIGPNQCFLDLKNWQPNTTAICPTCQNGGTADFNLAEGCHCNCQPGWKGDVCDTFFCQECAHSSGTCTGPLQCTCDLDDPVYIFGGSDCSSKCERAKCKNGGTVFMNPNTSCSCDCPYGWWGDDCQNPLCAVGPNGKLCSGYGTCETNGTCTCIHDVSFGTDCSGNCSAQICPSANGQVCGGHGYCECGACMCDRDFGGLACDKPDCTNVTSTPDPNGCGSNGLCMGDQSVPYCQCNPGWEGDRCDSFFCTNCSSEHGTCTEAPLPFCTCDKGWTSASCSEFTCDFLSNCTTPKGQCVYNASFGDMPKCACGPYWMGDDCTTAICPNSCSQQGTCVDSPAGSADPPYCQCKSPWIGDDCSQLPDCDPATDGELWSSPEWEARATSICYNTSFIDPLHNTSCIIDAQSLDNYEILYSLAFQKYQNCKLDESNGGPACGVLCPNFCSFNGLCGLDGTCTCDPGFFGLDCSLQVNRRAYLVQYNGGQERSEINQVVLPAAPATHLAISAGATHTTNEIAGAAVVYLYQDYRPLFGECKPYNNLYLIVLLDQATSSCTSGRNYKFSVTSTDAPIPLVLGNQCTAQQTAATTTTFSCSWTLGTNAAVVAGPLSQNTSWTLNFGLPTSDTECITSLYYASESLTGITDLTPVPPAEASDFAIVSEMSNSQCGTITDCGSCMAAAGCGWCPDIGYCMEGTASGPTLGMCSVWRYSNDEQDSRVVGSSGFYLNVVPSDIEVYLVPGSQIEIPVSVIVPKQPAIQVQFLVDLSAGMTPVVNTLSAQASTLFSSLVAAYPSSEVAVASFIDKPVEPYGENVTGDYVYYLKQLMSGDAGQFEDSVSDLLLGNGGDIPNAQLEALLQAALRSTGTGFTGPQNFVVMITGTPFHIPPTNFSMPNNLDTTTDINEDYPTIAEVRTALINANIAPVFVVTDSTWYPNYTALVEQLGFGYAVQATALDLVTPTMNGLARVLSSITLQATATQYVSSIYPESYSSIQPLSRVHFFVTLDRSATKRYELFDASLTLTAPGFGTVTFNLSSSDVPVGDAQLIQIKENTQVVITLGGDNIYHTDLTRTIASLPAGGILIQYDSKEIISTVGTAVTDPNNRVIYVPNVNGSCSYTPGEYCSRRRHVCTPCPYDSFSYSLVDGCACRSTNITVTLDVLANVVNNRPTASMAQQPSTLQDTALPITLTGSDPDNDTLWTIVTSLPTRGQLYEGSTNITQAMLPYNATSHIVTYVPPFHRWGDNFDSFTYYVNDGHAAYELGNSAPFTVSINVILTDNPPVVYNLSFVALENNNVLITLKVTDDQTDFTNGWIHVFILDFPNATQGTLQNIDGTLITEATNYVTDTVKWQVIFVPTLYAHGTPLFTFRYRAYDTQLYSDDAYVQVNITFVNQLPINLTPESITVLEDTPYNITFSCFDPEGDTIAWTIISPPTTGSLVDVVGGNKKLGRKSAMASTWAVYTPAKDSTQITAFTYYPNDRPASTVVTATDQMTIFITPVNDPPTITVTTTSYPAVVAASGSTTVVINNITVADVDVDLNFMTVNISLTGSGAITLTPPNPDVLNNLTASSNFITFSARLPDLNTLFKSALTYTIQDTLGQPSYLGTIFISITDNGFVGEGGAGYANVTIQVQTTVSASAHTSLALSLGALGVGVASAAGIGGVYKVLKYKNVFGEESDPFANMGDEQVDVVMENPLYQPSPRNSLQ